MNKEELSAQRAEKWREELRKSRKAKERTDIPRVRMKELDPAYRITNREEVNCGLTREQAVLEATRCLDCVEPLCMTGCPVGINIPKFIKNIGDILACKYYHSFAYPNGINAIGDCGSEKVDSKSWDIFHVHYETEDAYYGVPMLGMGLMDCMILKSDTRPFLSNELEHNIGLFGIHTDTFRRGYNIKIEPVVDKM